MVRHAGFPMCPGRRLGAFVASWLWLCLSGSGPGGPVAELPRGFVDTAIVPPTGRTIFVPAGGDFQEAVNAALPGDMIKLEAGATFTGPFTLPAKRGPGWTTIRTSSPSLVPPGTRAAPSHSPAMPKLVAASRSVLLTEPGAHHYRFIGVEISPSPGRFLYSLVALGSGTEKHPADLPHDIIFDRCVIHGDPSKGTRHGIAMNSRHTAVIDSYLSDFKEVGAESQAIIGWNGPGPFKIVNNYLEGAGENVMFGGADPSVPDLVPSDIEIRRNHFFKPLSWRVDDPSYSGTPWMIKNLFELKNARRVLIDGNIFEHNWPQAQNGFAILLTVRNQNGAAPWSAVEDVTFSNNIVRHSASGINILGLDSNQPSQRTQRIVIKNNLFDDIGSPRWGGGGILFQVLNGTADVVIGHNTAFQTGNIILADAAAHTRFRFINNIVPHNRYGIIGTDTGIGFPTLRHYFPGASVTHNVIIGGEAADYPPGNFFPASLDQVGFLDRAGGAFSLLASSPYKHAGTDGLDIGADIDALVAATGPTQPSTMHARPRAAGRAFRRVRTGRRAHP